MNALRTLLHRRHALAMLVIVVALAVKAIVPAGYMLGEPSGTRTITVMLCADQNASAMKIVLPTGDTSQSHGDTSHKAKDSPCAFGALAAAGLSGADPALLAVALEHVIALGFAPVTMPVLQGFFLLRPPLRGPPTLS